jgi:DNA polymerase (family 10)
MGALSEENVLKGIEQFRKHRERILLYEALPLAQKIIDELKAQSFVERAEMAGSLRRRKETIGDIDLLASSQEPAKVADFFTRLPDVIRIVGKGESKSTVVMKNGLQVDLRAVSPDEYGSALQYFTGSKEHSIHLRGIAKDRGMKISEYGIFDVKTDKRLGGKTEEEIYERLGMDAPPAIIREDRGEIEAAAAHQLPDLIKLSDLKGDLHVHSIWSDGHSSLEQLVDLARQLGYVYLGICDHAEKLKVAGGLSVKELEKRQTEIDKLNSSAADFRLLSGIELNIDNTGGVDYPDEILAGFDIVVGSIHSGFGQSREHLTERMITAMNNPHIDIIGHPTGRILGKREPYQLDLEAVFKAAAGSGTILELNSYPDRLDLRDDYLMAAKKLGCKFAINTDAHAASQLHFIEYGIFTAQRGWLEAEDVINTYPLERLIKTLKR